LTALGDKMAGKSPDHSILRQEATGQRQACAQTTRLPVDGTREQVDVWAVIGIKIGDPIEDDSIWCSVEMPAGWKLEPTDHSMWSKLVDDKGHTRAKMFYKAAFYDRSCHIHLCRRYGVQSNYDQIQKRPWAEGAERVGSYEEDEGRTADVLDKETGEVLYTTDVCWLSECNGGYNIENKKASAWLDENYPDWQDASAYWD